MSLEIQEMVASNRVNVEHRQSKRGTGGNSQDWIKWRYFHQWIVVGSGPKKAQPKLLKWIFAIKTSSSSIWSKLASSRATFRSWGGKSLGAAAGAELETSWLQQSGSISTGWDGLVHELKAILRPFGTSLLWWPPGSWAAGMGIPVFTSSVLPGH